jgi:putative ATPase
MPPQNILNAPTKLMKDIGYGAGYEYDHEAQDGFSGANYWPEEMEPQRYYSPAERGFEREVAKRMEWWEKKRQELRGE